MTQIFPGSYSGKAWYNDLLIPSTMWSVIRYFVFITAQNSMEENHPVQALLCDLHQSVPSDNPVLIIPFGKHTNSLHKQGVQLKARSWIVTYYHSTTQTTSSPAFVRNRVSTVLINEQTHTDSLSKGICNWCQNAWEFTFIFRHGCLFIPSPFSKAASHTRI